MLKIRLTNHVRRNDSLLMKEILTSPFLKPRNERARLVEVKVRLCPYSVRLVLWMGREMNCLFRIIAKRYYYLYNAPYCELYESREIRIIYEILASFRQTV